MAQKVVNQKNLLVIKMTWAEYVAASDTWGWCDLCQQTDFQDKFGYYIAGIDRWYCEMCYKAWYDSVLPRTIDVIPERENYNKMMNKLKQIGTWDDTAL